MAMAGTADLMSTRGKTCTEKKHNSDALKIR
ncbi:hypothetical protein C8J35_101650 [Rhizobium sp. PP-F2F-G38]|nr:hypothetical protein C8J37_101651 [Rhizobium sp. PP-WC-1G-195]PYF00830.1 hypothetical protein C8J35_101650 [Rhizobium sp. PP-F2F-G38]TCP90485.1 hypothetical protein C8J31_101325 [Rhizobium sp. PP-CC-2G-626]TCQ10071.1 hypothetical protein C8J34_102475 [Rhizobium sp. PP-F2F-G36]TCQ27846.1 hypothetical protein C8J33_101475 [Rhizobium sp. PP-CC-3G-465]